MMSNRTLFLCFPRDNPEATQQMNDLIIGKVSTALKGHWANPDLVSRPTIPSDSSLTFLLGSLAPPCPRRSHCSD